MTQFGLLFAQVFGAKIMLVGLNLVFGLPAVRRGQDFGIQLKKIIYDRKTLVRLNRILVL